MGSEIGSFNPVVAAIVDGTAPRTARLQPRAASCRLRAWRPARSLRLIAINRQWARVYNVMHALAKNPRTPMANTINILTRLQQRDLAALTKNRNVPDAVRRQAERLIAMRAGKG